MPDKYPHFRDFADPDEDEDPLNGEKIKIVDILGKKILILNFDIRKSKIKEGNYAIIQFEWDGEKHVVFTTATRLMKKLEQHKEKMPYHVTIIRKYKYYTMS